ncbi:MAG TPA: T9SS type A sorting domain-containing protein, partial [Flavobacterium sp.]|nr:T9SS type A sorting domain-containing protein [Flavobacterium sp.]
LPALNLREIQTASANAAPLNGNLGANQLNVSASTGITWNSGATLWIRWTDTDDTASDGLYAIDNFTFLGTSSLGTPENAIAGLSIYPNPVANGKLFITTSSSSEKTVAIFDVLGKQVINTTAAEPVDVSNLPGGVYIAKITQDGKTAARKLIIR